MKENNNFYPCPFCGHNNLKINYIESCIECQLCGMHGPICYDDDFVGSWNTRCNGETERYAFCPFAKDNKCRSSQCMIWNKDKSRCGLINSRLNIGVNDD